MSRRGRHDGLPQTGRVRMTQEALRIATIAVGAKCVLDVIHWVSRKIIPIA